jgi:hypothetical protein
MVTFTKLYSQPRIDKVEFPLLEIVFYSGTTPFFFSDVSLQLRKKILIGQILGGGNILIGQFRCQSFCSRLLHVQRRNPRLPIAPTIYNTTLLSP